MNDSESKIPVLGVASTNVSRTLDDCLGWASSEEEALRIVRDSPSTAETAQMMGDLYGAEFELGGVTKETIVVQDAEGPHDSSELGQHRYQEIFSGFLSMKRQ